MHRIISALPTVDAFLNAASLFMLLAGFVNIKMGKPDRHKKWMISALVSSGLFLVCYLTYHSFAGSVPYSRMDWTRYLYFIILIPHMILAGGMLPFIIIAVVHAFNKKFEKHKRITRWLWWVWVYVSFSGVMVYMMLYAR